MRNTIISLALCFVSLQGFAAEKLELKFALKYHMIKEKSLSVSEKFQLAKDLGYDGIELKSPSPDREAFKAASEVTGLPIHGVICSTHWKKQLSDPDPAVRVEGLEGFKQAIRDAAYLGAESVLLVPGKVTEENPHAEVWPRSIAAVREALPLAEELNIRILIENVWNGYLLDPEEMLRFVDELNHPLVSVYFDPGNSEKDSDPAEWPKVLGPLIHKLDIKGYKTSADETKPFLGFDVKIGEGQVDWPGICRELKAIGFSGWATAEVKGGGDKERLAEILANMKKALSY